MAQLLVSQKSKSSQNMFINVVDHDAGRYLMKTLGWDIRWNRSPGQRLPSEEILPTLQDISDGLANMTAALFWLGAYATTYDRLS
jgi:hypothetical protein